MKNKDENKPETAWEVFVRNYKNVKGVRLLTKLVIYCFIFIVLVIAMNITMGNKMPKMYIQTTTTISNSNNSYNNMLDRLLDNSDYKCEIKINDNNYIVDGSFGNNILTGKLTVNEVSSDFKIKDNTIYVINNEEETVNNELFKDIDYKLLLNNYLVAIIKNNKGIIVNENDETKIMKYDNVDINNNKYNIEVSRTNQISSIKLNSSDKYIYTFTFNYNN